MKNWFLGQGIPMYAQTILFVAGIITLWMSDRIYKRLIKEADLMGTSNHRLIKYIKLKVVSYFKIGMRPEDTLALSRRYIMRHKVGPFSLQTWQQLPGLIEAAMVIAGAGTMMYRFTAGAALPEAGIIFAVSLIGAAILHSLVRFVDYDSKETLLESTISDYVDNFLKNKLTEDFKNQTGPVPPDQYKRALSEVAAAGAPRRRERSKTYRYDNYMPPEGMSADDEVDAKIVEDVLKEFLN